MQILYAFICVLLYVSTYIQRKKNVLHVNVMHMNANKISVHLNLSEEIHQNELGVPKLH